MSTNQFTIPAVVPVAGLSSRFGEFKPLTLISGKPMIVRVIENLLAGGVTEIIVVTGHRSNEIDSLLNMKRDGNRGTGVSLVHSNAHGQDANATHHVPESPRIRCVLNEHFATGEMLSSVQAGFRALPAEANGVVLALGDQPFVRPATIRRLIEIFAARKANMVQPVFQANRGHPIVLSRKIFEQALLLELGESLKTITARFKHECIYEQVDDPGVVQDIDLPGDLPKS